MIASCEEVEFRAHLDFAFSKLDAERGLGPLAIMVQLLPPAGLPLAIMVQLLQLLRLLQFEAACTRARGLHHYSTLILRTLPEWNIRLLPAAAVPWTE
jgi:hypothetical protein